MAILPFQWGAGNRQITNPEQAAKQRAVAEALMLSGATPARNWAEGLSDITGAFSGSLLNNEVLSAEAEGAAQAGDLYSGLSSASPETDIIAALSNPWASPAQQSVGSALLGNPSQQNDPMRQIQLEQALLNLEQDMAGPVGPEAPSSVREWEYFNALPPDQQSQYLIMKRSVPYLDVGTGFVQPDPINPGQVGGTQIVKDNITPNQDKAIGTGLGEAQIEIINAGRSARSNNAKLDILETTLAGAPQGAQGALVQAAGSIGIPMEGLDDIQAAQAIINQLVPLQRLPGSGPMSDADLALFKQSLPSIINQPGGNKKIIATLRAINDYVDKAGDIELDLATNKISVEEADAKYRSLSNPLENYTASVPSATTIDVDGTAVTIRKK